MNIILATLIFILGSAIGSFLSVAIFRTHEKEKGIILSRSFCPYCKKKLRWHHMVPVFSWIFLGGKCAYCGKKISSHYLLLELVTGLGFLAIFLNWNFLLQTPSIVDPSFMNYGIDWLQFEKFLFYIVEFSFLSAIFFYDLMYKEIPDRFSIPAIGISLAAPLLFGSPAWLTITLGTAVIGGFFLVQFVLSKGKWIGGGDIRLGVLMGTLLGLEKGLIALASGYIFGGIIGIILILQRKAHRKTAIPLGPFLVTGILIAIFYGEQILDFYLI